MWLFALREPLWLDETLAYWQVSGGFWKIWGRSEQTHSSIGYLYTLWAAKSILGSHAIALKIPSSLAMLGAVYFLYRIAREFFDQEIAFLTCIFFCLQPNVAYAATDALPYAFGLLATNIAILVFIRWLMRRRMHQAILFGIASSAVLYFSFPFGAILPALAIYYLAVRYRSIRADGHQLAAALTAFTVLALPVVVRVIVLHHTPTSHVVQALPAAGITLNTLVAMPVLIGSVLTTLVAALVRKIKLPGPDCFPAILLWPLLAIVPAGLLFIVNATRLQVVDPRSFLITAPAIALTGGLLASRIDSRLLRQTFCAGLVAIAVFQSFSSRFVRQHELNFERDVPIVMRDGTTLRADICRPIADGKFPVLLTRTPYDKNGALGFCRNAVAHGYVVVAQDVRGRYASEGDWYPFKYESQDGYDTVEWAAALPYSNGKVGMFGGSYVGATQYLAAIAMPPHLAAICPNFTASNYHDGWIYHGGAFEQWFNESWTAQLAENNMSRLADSSGGLPRVQNQPPGTYPAPGAPTIAAVAPYFNDWLTHPDYDGYWKQWSIEDHYTKIQVPVFSVGGWYDIFLDGTLRNYIRLKHEAGTDAARRGQRLLIYAGGHAGAGWADKKIGAVDFGNKLPLDLSEVTLRWFDSILQGIENGVDHEKPVKIFVMGKNAWREEDDWPLARAKETRYYLHSTTSANGIEGGGTLDTAAPAEEKPDQYLYDPNDAVPTIGGPLCCEPLPTGIGPQNQSPAEARSDVLVFSSPALTRNTEVTGPIVLDLYVSSSALDTDFTGKLVDVWPSGFAQNLTDGVLRLRYRNSQETPQLANPGDVYHISVDLGATSNVFQIGHKLRLEVSSSNFPRFDRNRNTGGDQARETHPVKATNIIYHDKSRPSALVLPIVP
jgi:putative CocE/NonD family hydrolase